MQNQMRERAQILRAWGKREGREIKRGQER